MECEVKSVTLEKVKAWQEIGVTRTSFGVQTFHPLYRQLFNLTSSIEQIRRVQGWFNERFKATNVDMIHSIAGQTLDELLQDVDDVNSLETTTVDYYTLNNGVAQPRLHRAFAEHGLRPISAHTRLSYRMYLNEYLRSQGFVPNNSYSFIRSTAQPSSPRVVMQHDPVFLYQDISYGYANDLIDAYGPGAQSFLGTALVGNIENREQYAARLLSDQPSAWCTAYHTSDGNGKGLVYFSYRGELDKARIDWTKVDENVKTALAQAVSNGLAVEESDRYTLTETGWLFAVNLMYMLMPWKDQEILSKNIARRDATPSKQPDDVIFMPRKRTVVPVISAN
jgi:oxygen-independent coproporphyrinogen-3 oxidase